MMPQVLFVSLFLDFIKIWKQVWFCAWEILFKSIILSFEKGNSFICLFVKQPSSLQSQLRIFWSSGQSLSTHKTPTHHRVCQLGWEAAPPDFKRVVEGLGVGTGQGVFNCRDMPIRLSFLQWTEDIWCSEENFKKIGFAGWVVNSWDSFPGISVGKLLRVSPLCLPSCISLCYLKDTFSP